MPTYDYVCDDCGHAFELFQGISEKLRRKCPECGRQTLRRLIGAGAGIVFKGSGFYETDYKRAKSKPSEGGDSDKSSGSTSDKPTSGSSGKGTKPAEKGPSSGGGAPSQKSGD